jgi:hypothetical protein
MGLSNLDRQQERKCGQRGSLSCWATGQVGWSELVDRVRAFPLGIMLVFFFFFFFFFFVLRSRCNTHASSTRPRHHPRYFESVVVD